MAATPGKNYVLGKGKLFFDQFAPGSNTGTGEMYFGNTPELTTTSDQTTLDHYDADAGLNVKDDSVTTEQNNTGSFTTDNISNENVALFYQGIIERKTVVSGPTADTLTLRRGRHYQLGSSADHPAGARNVTGVTVTVDGAVVAAEGNYVVDSVLGRIEVLPNAEDIEDGDVATVAGTAAAGVQEIIIGRGDEIRGALRFVSNNPKGTQKDYFWPSVKLTPNGDFALKGDDWQTIPFNFEALKKDEDTEFVYITPRG